MQNSMKQCRDALRQGREPGPNCEQTFRREFHKRLAISIASVALGVVGVLVG